MFVVRRKAQEQEQLWEEQWQRKQEIEDARNRRKRTAYDREAKKALAESQTEDAKTELDNLRNILKETMSLKLASWSSLYDRSKFTDPAPIKASLLSAPTEPKLEDAAFRVTLSFLDKLIPPFKKGKLKDAADRWVRTHAHWKEQLDLTENENARRIAKYDEDTGKWNMRREAFIEARDKINGHIDELRQRHLDKDESAVIEFTDLILARSEYPHFFPKKWEIGFQVETGVMVIDYDLPNVEQIPNLLAIRYISSKNTFENVYLKDREVDQLYEAIVYQTCLRTIREIYASDLIDAIKSLTFNGYVDFINREIGRPARSCIVSIQTTKAAIENIDFSAVDPKACFRALKGAGSAKLSGMAAVVPILRLNRVDDRFVPARGVIDGLNETVNIAAIPWEDFEHLVRDVFEKEFSSPGGEVKITRASRDHGVDAVAFDPDPIRGGKIVIQAKRYTNPVGVSAVRDLYGTVINEGANRGILVTTSVYGPDSYDFAKDKPITLLTGGHLLSLLEKHGHPARIDLLEAKKLHT
jgi:restriction system protein